MQKSIEINIIFPKIHRPIGLDWSASDINILEITKGNRSNYGSKIFTSVLFVLRRKMLYNVRTVA